jgi:hypothetical protein
MCLIFDKEGDVVHHASQGGGLTGRWGRAMFSGWGRNRVLAAAGHASL